MRALLAALLLLAAFAPPAAASVRCDWDSSQDYTLGTSYVHATSHRCTYSSSGATHTQRLERYDAFVYDPQSPSGHRPAGSFVLESTHTRESDGSTSTSHRVALEKDGASLAFSYAGARDANHRESCTATTAAHRMPTGSAQLRTPLLPACWPDGFLLP